MFDYEQSVWGKGTATLNWSDPARFRLKRALLSIKNLPAGAKVLEIGCGGGQFIRAVKTQRPDLNCFGCDISQNAIAFAQSQMDGVNYAVGTAEKLPYEANGFDAVLIFDVLEHVESPKELLREAIRVLAVSGLFYGFVPCEGDILSWWHWLKKINIGRDWTKKHAGHINFFTRRSVLELWKQAGFKIISRKYSEHFFGQALNFFSFFFMERAGRLSGRQINNEVYFEKLYQGGGRGFFLMLRRLVNGAVNLEANCLQFFPSSNIHLTAKKI